jgi:hypothetical protein
MRSRARFLRALLGRAALGAWLAALGAQPSPAVAAPPPATSAQPSLAPPAAPSPATDVRVMVPFEAGRRLVSALTVSARASGACWTASLASASRADAWRCTAVNRIHDPCFAGFIGADPVAACPPDPWSSEVVLLSLSGTPPGDVTRPPNLLDGPPWAVELVSGERCTMLTGATWGVAGMRANYGCSQGVSVVGEIDRRGPTWRAFVLRAGAAMMSQVEIRIAYY